MGERAPRVWSNRTSPEPNGQRGASGTPRSGARWLTRSPQVQGRRSRLRRTGWDDSHLAGGAGHPLTPPRSRHSINLSLSIKRVPAAMASPARIRATIASVTAAPDELREMRAFHKALADVNRLRLVRRLADGPATVAGLTAHGALAQ